MALKPGYKQTEVGVIPEDWEVSFLSSATLKIQDGTHFSPKLGGNDFLYITSKNIRHGYIDLSKVDRIDTEQHKAIYKRCDVKYGDLLLTKDGASTGNAAFNSMREEFSLLSSVALLRFDSNKHDANYFLQQILSQAGQQRISEAMSGNAITRLTLDKIKKLVYPIPPTKTEQTAIANTLSDADALIQSLTSLIAKKRQIKQGTMQTLLNPYENGQMKEGWVVKRLGRVAEFINGRAYSLSEWESHGTPVIRLQNLTGRGDEFYYSNLKLPEKQHCVAGDLLFMWSATFGPVIWKGEKAIYHYHIWKIEYKPEESDKTYLYFVLDDLTERLKRSSSSGGTMLHITKGKMESIEVHFPALEEQTRIATILSGMDTEIAALEAKLAKYRHIKQGMMQNLLTGRIRLVQPDSNTGAVA